mmetsp:Transcript_48746/g.96991  ORF Transcript_48746/g.96991 Transcript_48746/m.96991 type:complete len:263 (-) Transcript_48746:340-1128(-)
MWPNGIRVCTNAPCDLYSLTLPSFGAQIDRSSSSCSPSVFQTRSKALCAFHLSLNWPLGSHVKASLLNFTGARDFGRASLSLPVGLVSMPGLTAKSLNLSDSIAALNSSTVMSLSLSVSMNWKRALTSCGQRAESLVTLCKPSHSRPAASSVSVMKPSLSASKCWNASATCILLASKAHRSRDKMAFTVRSSNSSAFVKTLATESCWCGFCALRLQERMSSHQGSLASSFVRCRERSRTLRSRAWKLSALLANRSNCSAPSS